MVAMPSSHVVKGRLNIRYVIQSISHIGLFSASDVESMLAEITKMKDLHHLNVMSLIGVCLDAGPGVSIVMPFMANGSLLDYLKKERATLYLPDTSELEDVSQCSCLYELTNIHD